MATIVNIKTKDMSTDEEKLKHRGAKELQERFFDILRLIEKDSPEGKLNISGVKVANMLLKLNMIYQDENIMYTNVDLPNNHLWELPDKELADYLLTYVNVK